jgi:tetratricopeptide (TPR) repeat protein
LLLLTGEPGIGKTRLAREGLRRGLAGEPWLLADAVAQPTNIPFGVIDQLVRKLLASGVRPPTGVLLDALRRFVPDALADEAAPVVLDQQLERKHLFDAFRIMLETNPDPTVLFIDDLQWADANSVELLEHVLHQDHPSGLMLLGTCRSADLNAKHLASLFGAMARQELGVQIALEGLNESETFDLIEASGHEQNAFELHRRSGGNLLFLQELLRAPIGSNLRLQDLARQRIQSMSEESRQVLDAVVIAGGRTGLSVLKKIAGRSEEEITRALEELTRASILKVDGINAGLQHDLMRSVVLEDMNPSRQGILNLRSGRALFSQIKLGSASTDATTILAAQHFTDSSAYWEEPDQKNAIEAMVQAGRFAGIRGDLNTCIQWLETALTHATSSDQKANALTENAQFHERFGRHEQAEAAFKKTDLLMRLVQDPVLQAKNWNARANLLALKYGRIEEAEALLQKSILAVQDIDRESAFVCLSDAFNIAGTLERLRGNHDRAIEKYKAALEIREVFGHKQKVLESMNNLALTYSLIDHADTEALHLQTLDKCDEINDVSTKIRVYNNLGIFLMENKTDYRNAEKYFKLALSKNKEINDQWLEIRTTHNLAVCFSLTKNLEQAKEQYVHCIAMSEEVKDLECQLYASIGLVEIYLEEKNVNKSSEFLEKIQAITQRNEINYDQKDIEDLFIRFQEIKQAGAQA